MIGATDTNFSPLIPYFLVGTTKRWTIVEINYRYFTRMIYLAVLLARIGNSLLLLSSIVECTWTVLSIQRFSILNGFASPISLSNLTDFPNSRWNNLFHSSPFHSTLLFSSYIRNFSYARRLNCLRDEKPRCLRCQDPFFSLSFPVSIFET